MAEKKISYVYPYIGDGTLHTHRSELTAHTSFLLYFSLLKMRQSMHNLYTWRYEKRARIHLARWIYDVRNMNK